MGAAANQFVPERSNFTTNQKLAVLAATIVIIGVILAVHGGDFEKIMTDGVDPWRGWGAKKIEIFGNLAGICTGLFVLGAANAFMFSNKYSFADEVDMLGEGSIKDEVAFIMKYKTDVQNNNRTGLYGTMKSCKEKNLGALLRLAQRIDNEEFKGKSETEISKIINEEKKKAEKMRKIAYAVLAVAAVLALITIGLTLTNLGYTSGYGYWTGNTWTLKPGVAITAAISSLITGLMAGGLLGRRKEKYGESTENSSSVSAVQQNNTSGTPYNSNL